MPEPRFFSVAQVADRAGCRPRDVSDFFYQGHLDESRILRIAGRRAIPADYVPEICLVLKARGKTSRKWPS